MHTYDTMLSNLSYRKIGLHMYNRKKENKMVQFRTTLKPSKETLEKWHETYIELYDYHCRLVLSKNGLVQVKNNNNENLDTARFNIKNFNVVTQSIELHSNAEDLNEKLYQLAAECQTTIGLLISKNEVCNDTLIMYLKIVMLHGVFLSSIHMYDKAYNYFQEVIGKMKKYGNQLGYEYDMEFQHAIGFLFSIVEIEGESAWYIKLKNDFAKKCSNTIVGLNISYDALLDMYANKLPEKAKNNPELGIKLRNTKNNFIFQEARIRKQYKSLQQEGKLSPEDKLYFIKLNYLTVNMLNITQPERIFSVEKIKGKFVFSVHHIPKDELFEKYLKSWEQIKETNIKPAFELIKSIDVSEIGMKIHAYFNIVLDEWMSEFHMILFLFNSMIENWMQRIESDNKLTNEASETIKKYIILLDTEKNILLEYANVIRGLLEPFSHVLRKETRLMSAITYEKISQCDNRINLIREDLQRIEEEKSNLAEKTYNELISDCDALREKQIRQYILNSKKKITIDKDYSPEEKRAPQNSSSLIKNNISPYLIEYLKLDEECFKLADELYLKIVANNKFLTQRSSATIPFPSNCQNEVMLHINGLLAEFYYLISLFEKFDTFSKNNEIIERDDLQEGIACSRTLFKQRAMAIHSSINTMLELMNNVIDKQNKHRDNRIYKFGLDFSQQENLLNPSYEEIMNYGRNIFKQIGINKSRNRIPLSEFTKLRDFLSMMQLSFSSFSYLQNKMIILLRDPLQKFKLFSSQPELKKHELTPGVIEEIMGMILKTHYLEFNNEACLHQALIHFQEALNLYEKEGNDADMTDVQNRIHELEKSLQAIECTSDNSTICSLSC